MASSSSNFVSDSFLPLFLWNSISTDAKPSHRVTHFSSSHLHFSSSHLHFSGLSSLWSAFLQACFPRSLPGSAVVTSEPDSAFFIVIIIYLISSFFSFIKNISSPSLPSLLLAINHSHLNILSDNSKPQITQGAVSIVSDFSLVFIPSVLFTRTPDNLWLDAEYCV